MDREQKIQPRRPTRRAVLKGLGAAGALVGAAGPQVLLPTLWRRAGASVDPPFAPHLEFGTDPARQMTVSWLTSGAVSHPRVRFGPTERDMDTVVPAATRTYVDGLNSLSPTEVFTQHAALDHLRPDTTYVYEISHDGAPPVSAQFKTAPTGRGRFRFTSFGDQSIPLDPVNNPTNSLPWTPYAGLIVPQVEATQPLFHLYNGDLCYANVRPAGVDRTKIWRSFLSNNSRSARNRPWMPAAGNHEDEKKNNSNGVAAGPFFPNYLSYQTYFALPPNGSAEFHGLWYAFQVGSMLVISLNNDDVCYQDGSAGNGYVRGYSGGAQKAFLKETLAGARASNDIDWIVVVMHQVAMSTAIPFNGSELGIREEWLPLFDQFGVDLVLTGHEHHYERTFAVRGQESAAQFRRPIPASFETDSIDTTKGTVHMILGGGGHSSASSGLFSIKNGLFESELLVPSGNLPPASPTVTPKPRELATWSATSLAAPNPTTSHARDSFHGYGFATFDVNPGSDAGGWTTIDVRYHRVLNPSNPADTGKEVEFDSFQLRRRRRDGGEQVLASAEAGTTA